MPPAENSEVPKYNLPPPVEGIANNAPSPVEQMPNVQELINNSSSAKVSNPPTTDDFQLPGNNTDNNSTKSLPTTTSNPPIADDNDLIEKEWVSKVKRVIESNREDPYNQSKAITNLRADYMKKRYNKIIRASE